MSSFRLSNLLLLPVVGLPLLTGACGAPLAVSAVSYGSDGAFLVTTDKTGTDHLASMVSGKDCALWRAFRSRDVCKEREGDKDPYAIDYNTPQRSVAEDGTTYGPPLRAAPDAPPASWDAAVYKSAPPPPTPAESVTAVAEAAPVQAAPAQKSAAPVTTSKAKKGKTAGPAKKPSRGPAAPAS